MRADTPAEVRAALAAARGSDGVDVIVAATERHRDLPPSGVWWDVAPSEVSDDEVVRALREQYEHDRASLQRFYY